MYNTNIDGFHNEIEIRNYLNNKKIYELNVMYKMFIDDLFGNVSKDSVIKCDVDFDNKKFDIVISINDIVKRVSVKKGINNSVHVEGISSFVHFLIDSGVSRRAVIEYLKYHYADGTTNGTGIHRISVKEYKINHQKDIDFINEQINTPYILKRAICRFVLQGKNSNIMVDAILYGTLNDFIWINSTDVENIIMSQIGIYSTGVHFGPLYCQPMTRCLNHNIVYDRKRFCVQIKWYTIFDDIIKNMNEKGRV